jgi:hypothetical protein
MKGMKRGLSPSADWDSGYYLRRNPDVAEDVNAGRRGSAVNHWIEFGIREHRAPNARFDGKLYLENYPAAADEIRRQGLLGAYEHFATFGRERRWLAETVSPEERLRASGLFDPDVYLALNPDLTNRCMGEYLLSLPVAGRLDGQRETWRRTEVNNVNRSG